MEKSPNPIDVINMAEGLLRRFPVESAVGEGRAGAIQTACLRVGDDVLAVDRLSPDCFARNPAVEGRADFRLVLWRGYTGEDPETGAPVPRYDSPVSAEWNYQLGVDGSVRVSQATPTGGSMTPEAIVARFMAA